MMTRMLRLSLPIIVITALLQRAAAVETPTLETIEKTARQLASPLSTERITGEEWLESNASGAFAELARLIKHGDIKQQTRAANAASVLISPWSRAVRQGAIHKGQIHLFQPRRPVARPTNQQYAHLVRTAALSTISRTLKQRKARKSDNDADGKRPIFPGWEATEQVRVLCGCIAEVADVDAANKLAELISKEPNRFLAGYMMGVLDTYHGLPRSYAWYGICGNSTPEEFRQFDIAETVRCKKAAAKLLDWHKQHANKPLTQRIDAALDVWDKRIVEQEHFAYYTDSGEWAAQTYYATMIRLGEPAVEAMRKRAARANVDKYWHRGAYEIVLGAITGEVDREFVEKMFQGETFEKMLACEIIAAAGSRDFKDQLAAMVQSHGPYKKASYTLAVVYRSEAVSILQKAHADDFVASCAIAELREWGE
jgi:hypothetical protein